MTSLPEQPPVAAPAVGGSEFFCPGCGYDLRGLAQSERCPECGLAIDRTAAGVSRIPWAHRRRLGRFRAYFATVRLTTLNPRKLAEEIYRPVGYADAQRFRLVTVALAAVGPLGFLIAPMLRGQWFAADDAMPLFYVGYTGQWDTAIMDLTLPWFAGARLHPVLPAAFLLLFVLVTGAGSYWFAPRWLSEQQQNRAIALSYYTSAPLALLPVLAALIGLEILIAGALGGHRQVEHRLTLAIVATCMALLLFIVYTTGNALLKLLQIVNRGRPLRTVWAAPAIILSLAVAAVLAVGVFPWVVGFVALVIDSFG